MSKKKELHIGDEVQMTDEEIERLSVERDQMGYAENAFKLASVHHKKATDRLWELIFSMRPELKGRAATINWDTNKVAVGRKRDA